VSFIAIVLLGVVEGVVHGLVLKVLWGWFVVSLFHLPQLTIASAIGLTYVASMLRPVHEPNIEEKEWWDTFWDGITRLLGGPPVIFVLGWVVHLFL